MKVVECVPNFSEGRDRDIIKSISEKIKSVSGVSLLDVSSGYETNRTVFTFAGEPEAVLHAAYNSVVTGFSLIDMSEHSGAHPRIGACDVFPFVPVSHVSMEECVGLARRLGKKVGKNLEIPVYLYGHAATKPERRELSSIRSGEYEGLEEKLQYPEWAPDFGPSVFSEKVKRSGAIIIGAREFLIAFNLNLNTKDKDIAHVIAQRIRESGRVVTDERGRRIRSPGKLQFCKAIGWYVEDFGRAQISINLTNYKKTNMHHALEAASEEAARRGVQITGAEIVGLVPKRAIIDSGIYYLQKRGGSLDKTEAEIINVAVEALGLNELEQFKPNDKILEYRIH